MRIILTYVCWGTHGPPPPLAPSQTPRRHGKEGDSGAHGKGEGAFGKWARNPPPPPTLNPIFSPALVVSAVCPLKSCLVCACANPNRPPNRPLNRCDVFCHGMPSGMLAHFCRAFFCGGFFKSISRWAHLVLLDESQTPRGEVPVVMVVFAALFCDLALTDMGVAFIPGILRDLRLPSFCNALLLAVKPLVQIAVSAFVGALVNKGSARNYLLVGTGSMAVFTCCHALGLEFLDQRRPATTFAALATARGLQGVASAFIGSAGFTLIARTHGTAERPRAMSAAQMGISLGIIAGPYPSACLASWRGPASPYHVLTGLLLVLSAAIGAVPAEPSVCAHEEEAPERVERKDGAYWTQLQDAHLASVHCVTLSANTAISFLQPLVGPHAQATLGFSPTTQGLMWLSSSVAFMATRPLSVLLTRIWPEWKVISLGVVLAASVVFLAPLPYAATTMSGMLLLGLGVGFMSTPCPPLLADIAELADCSHGYATVYSMLDAATSTAFVIGPLLSIPPLPFTVQCRLLSGFLLCNMICAGRLRSVARRKMHQSLPG